MFTEIQKFTCQDFVDQFFAVRNNYSKYDSPENRSLIVERVVSFGVYPSATATKRACLELLDEGLIQRTDGKDASDDAIDEKVAAEEADRQKALATPLTQMDASLYAALSWSEICERCKNDRLFRYRYEAACRLFGFRFPIGLEPVEESQTVDGPDIPQTADEYHAIPIRIIQTRYQREPRFKAAVQRLIAAGQI
jgi:hypothetical protein